MGDQVPGAASPPATRTEPLHGECQYQMPKRFCMKPGSVKLLIPYMGEVPPPNVWKIDDNLGTRFVCFQHADREIARLRERRFKVTPKIWKSCPTCKGVRYLPDGAVCRPCIGTGETRAKVPSAADAPIEGDDEDDEEGENEDE